MAKNTVYLNQYTPFEFKVGSVALRIDLYDTHALVQNTMTLFRLHPGELVLFGDELELEAVVLNGEQLDKSAYRLEQGNLHIPSFPDKATLEITTRIYPQKNTQLMGLYRSNHLFCTQCEAEGFRRITFYPDRPDVLSEFTTRISADKTHYPVLLANGNLIEEGEEAGNRHFAVWHDPFKKPCYLFAMVAGQLACIKDTFKTYQGRTIDLRIYVEPGNEDLCTHAMASLKQSMRWDEEKYGREYDLDIFMIVAVSDFNMGAMENKGLNIFNSKYILGRKDTATDQDFADIEGVVAHEYFHNWTGNRVTCRDWFQLSLKEGLTVFRDQEFSRDMNSKDVNRIMDVKALRIAQFPEDAGAMAHPVRPESYEEINNFYTATIYNKGAEVIRMQHTLLGREGFRKGMDVYFERHDGQAVTIDDFVAAMSDANGVDLSQFMHWYSQAGTPNVTVHSAYEHNTLTLQFSQHCRPTAECKEKKAYHIPIALALFKANGERIEGVSEVLELKQFEHTFTFSNLPEKPIVSLLRGFSAPIKLFFQRTLNERLDVLRVETDGFAKWDAAQQCVLEIMASWRLSSDDAWHIPEAYTDALKQVLADERLDDALKAELITMPGFEECAGAFEHNLDVERIEAIREHADKALGQALWSTLSTLYDTLWAKEDHAMQARSYGRRKLRHACLTLMMAAKEDKALPRCQAQYEACQTMTDELSSFGLLSNAKDPVVRQNAASRFYSRWQHDALVLDKWFSVQASARVPNVLTQVKSLLEHPQFSIKNPNKVRALVGAFCMNNPRYFHALDGSGYRFLTDMILALDALNPQVAARLATPFTRWKRYDAPRQALMREALGKLLTHTLSDDVSELVRKSFNEVE